MTFDESINILKQYIDYNNPDVPDFYAMAEAIEWILEALEQEPCGDCISRQAVLDGLASIAKAKAKSDAQKSLIGRVMFFTEHLPPVTQQPKMGRWNFTKHYGRDYYVCLVCGMERMDDHSSGWNYCPNCGTKMQEVEDADSD